MLNKEHHHLQNKTIERRVLVVDDDQDFVGNLVDILELRNYKIEAAYRLSEALKIINDFDAQVVLMDLRLPDGSGIDLLSELKQEKQDCVCILLTAYADVDSTIAALEKGAFDYLIKPINPTELIKLLDRAFEMIHLREEKQQAEKALIESEEKYRQVVSTAKDAIMVVDPDTRQFLEVNKACEDTYGYSYDEFLKMRHTDITTEPEDSEDTIRKAVAGKLNSIPLRYHRKKDGTVFPVEISVSVFVHKGKKVLCGIVRDITERRRIEEVLQFTQFAVDNNADATYWVKSDAKIFYANKAACHSLGYSYGELTCMRVPDIDPDFPEESWLAHWQEMKEAGTLTFEACHKTKAGFVFPVEVQSTYLEYDGQEYICAFVRKITQRKQAEEQIKASLREKDILIKEIYHRTKNNMAIICSLLNLQSKYARDEKLSTIFKEMDNRIKSMSLVHSKLYESKDLSNINLKSYIKDLAHNLFSEYHINSNKISLKLMAEDVPITFDSAIPCGLVINELITNSLKHAFPDNREGEIRIDLILKDKGEFELKFADNGIGMPEGFDLRKTYSFGLQIVVGLIEKQLSGKVELNLENGVEFLIKFKESNRPKRI